MRLAYALARSATAGFALAALNACQVPEAPSWQIGVTVPMTTDTFTWVDLLPPSIDTATVDGELFFVIHLPQDSTTYRLNQLCPPCAAHHGETIQIPPFEFSDSIDIRYPEDLVSVGFQEASLAADVQNGLNFDLGGSPSGSDTLPYVVLVLRDLASGATLDSLFLQRGADPLPPGSTWSPALGIRDREIEEGVRLVAHVSYPGSSSLVEIDTTRAVTLLSRLDGVRISGVTVVLDNVPWDADHDIRLDQKTRDEIVDHFDAGEISAVVYHDLDATSNLEISFAATPELLFSGDPQNELRLPELELTSGLEQTVDLTLGQLEQIAAFPNPFYVGYRGVANGTETGPGGLVNLARITPGQYAQLRFRLRSQLSVGE